MLELAAGAVVEGGDGARGLVEDAGDVTVGVALQLEPEDPVLFGGEQLLQVHPDGHVVFEGLGEG